jgi:hypothetical protein
VLKKGSRNANPVDVPADNPRGTMDRFADGLRTVLAADKSAVKRAVKYRQRKFGSTKKSVITSEATGRIVVSRSP